jgi:hypothetical protein
LKNQRKQYEVPKKLQTLGLPNLILAVYHYHLLRSLAEFDLSDAFALFFAGAKLPSINASDQSNWPRDLPPEN